MSLTTSDVEKIAKLARIAVNPTEKEKLHKDLLGIFHWIDQLKDVDVDHIDLMEGVEKALMHERDDHVGDKLSTFEVLQNAPQKLHTFFCVPKVIE